MIRTFEAVTSTQDEMKAWLRDEGARPFDAVFAHRQTHGRGRQGAEWISTEKNFFASIFLEPKDLPLTWVPLWLGLTTLEVLGEVGFHDSGIRLKWPNDLVIDRSGADAKLAGILCEKVEGGVVAGIGMNVMSAPMIQGRETVSLASMADSPLSPEFGSKLLKLLIDHLKKEPRVEGLKQRFDRVSILVPGNELEWIDLVTGKGGQGTFEGLGAHGELLVRSLPDSKVESDSGILRLFSEEVRRLKRH